MRTVLDGDALLSWLAGADSTLRFASSPTGICLRVTIDMGTDRVVVVKASLDPDRLLETIHDAIAAARDEVQRRSTPPTLHLVRSATP